MQHHNRNIFPSYTINYTKKASYRILIRGVTLGVTLKMDELKIPFLTVFAWLIFHSSPIFRTVLKSSETLRNGVRPVK